MTPTRLTLSLATAVLLFAQDRIHPGLWENTVTAEGRTATGTHCLTEHDLLVTNGSLQTMREATEKSLAKNGKALCTLKDMTLEGSTITTVMLCGPSSVVSKQTFHGDSSETTRTWTKDGVITTTRTVSRRLGVCPK